LFVRRRRGSAWRWLASIGREVDQPGLRVAVDEAYGAVLAVQARRDRLDGAIVELATTPTWAPVVARLACLRGVGVLTGFGLAVEIGDWHRFTGPRSAPGWAWCPASSPAAADAAEARSPRPATAVPAGCWSRRPGITADPIDPAENSAPATPASRPRSERAPTPASPAASPSTATAPNSPLWNAKEASPP
jgi:hypothetical protein